MWGRGNFLRSITSQFYYRSHYRNTGYLLNITFIFHKCCSSPFGTMISLQWRHNERDGVSNQQPHDCLLSRLFRRRSKKISKHCVTGLCAGNSPVTDEFLAQVASNADNISIWWCHYVEFESHAMTCNMLKHVHGFSLSYMKYRKMFGIRQNIIHIWNLSNKRWIFREINSTSIWGKKTGLNHFVQP